MELTAIALWLNTAFASFDESMAIAIHRLFEAAGWFFTPLMNFVSLLGKGGALLMLISFILMLYRPTRRYGTTMLAALAVGALITNLLAKPLVARPRPYTLDGTVYQQFWAELGYHTEADKCFPSGHTTAAMAFSTAVFLTCDRRKSWLAFLFPIFMGISRIYLSVHYTSDVLGGFLLGGIGGVAAYFLVPLIPRSYYDIDVEKYLPRALRPQKGRHER